MTPTQVDPAVAAELTARIHAAEPDSIDLHLEIDILDAVFGSKIGDWPDWAGRMSFNPTYSISDALRLLGYILPGYGWRLQTQLGGRLPVATLHQPPDDPDAPLDDGRGWSRHYSGGHATDPAKALTVALLSALSALPGEGT